MADKDDPQADKGLPILTFGFRPFFFLAGVHGAAALLLWLAIQVDSLAAPAWRPSFMTATCIFPAVCGPPRSFSF
jgi:uncharacterized protein involved in response to NO